MRRPCLAVVAMGCAIAVAGCGTDSANGGSPVDFDEYAAQQMDLAREEGASERQLAIMQEAADRGEVVLEDVYDAFDNTFACLDDFGIAYVVQPPTQEIGIAVLSYALDEPPEFADAEAHDPEYEAWLALADSCRIAHSAFVESMYRSQPASIEASDLWFTTTARPVLVACLERNDVVISAEASRDELEQAANDLLSPRGEDGVPMPAAPGAPNCFDEAGY